MTQHLDMRVAIVDACRRMNALGINQGSSGNIGVRVNGDAMLVTPSGVAYDDLALEHIALMPLDDADEGRWTGPLKPSSEWRFHRDILASRPEFGAVVHTHSVHASALSCQRRGVPAFHYMVAVAGGADIRCAEYATFGTPELSANALAALEGRRACLLANHGLIAAHTDLNRALALAVEVETLARQYLLTLQVGEPVLLGADEMAVVLAKFASYGQAAPRSV